MRTLKLLAAITFLTLLLTTCGESIVGPKFPPGIRDYVWTLDTLKTPFNYFTGLWGSSSSDVWTVGGGGNDEDRLWHFDGTKWSPYTKERIICTGETLFGFSKDNVWMGGGDGRIWHYNGNTWQENFVYKPKEGWAIINDIWGRKGNDLYAVGVNFIGTKSRAFVLHYDGNNWAQFYKADYPSQFPAIKGDAENIFIVALKVNDDPHAPVQVEAGYIKKIDKGNLIDVFTNNGNPGFSLAYIGSEVHFIIQNSIYKYFNKEMTKIMDINEPNFAFGVYGRNYKDLFIKLYDGVGHYNGTDIVYLYKFTSNYSYYSGNPVDFGNSIFFNIPHTRNLRGFLK